MNYYHDEYYCCFHENFPIWDAAIAREEERKKRQFTEHLRNHPPISEYCNKCQLKNNCKDNIYNNVIWCPKYKE